MKPTSRKLYIFASTVGLFCAGIAICFLGKATLLPLGQAEAEYTVSFFSLLGVIFSMEARVLLGKRLPRTKIFWFHLVCSVPLLISVALLSFYSDLLWLRIFTVLSALGTTGSAVILFSTTTKKRLARLESAA